ncbi:hypothetical protein TNCV_2775991 [Trichonephila clavipes]|nr:hypothetical protein TNCV_2775991 [Trichonephila clavipes]
MWSMVAQLLTQITPSAATQEQFWQRMEAAWDVLRLEPRPWQVASFRSRFVLNKIMSQFQFTAPAREDCLVLAACYNGHSDCPLSAAVRLPFFLSMDTRGESETYKKDGTDKDYTTNT